MKRLLPTLLLTGCTTLAPQLDTVHEVNGGTLERDTLWCKTAAERATHLTNIRARLFASSEQRRNYDRALALCLIDTGHSVDWRVLAPPNPTEMTKNEK